MGLFRKDKSKVLAPMSGKVIPVTEIPDDVFSQKVLGDGIAIQPDSGEVVSPVSGTIVTIAHSFHAIAIEGDDSAEILVHLGIDTVELEGAGFTCHVKSGDHVTAGQKLMDMDLEFIKSKGYSTVSPCIVTNLDQIKKLTPITGPAEAGKTVVLTYES